MTPAGGKRPVPAEDEHGMRTPRAYRLWRIWVAAVVLATPGAAEAFYWAGWPGSGVKQNPSVIPPVDVGKPGNPPPPGGTPIPLPPTGTPTQPGPFGPPSSHTPEPTTGVAALIGLAFVVASRRFRRNRLT
ncbi:MAG: hypothetical protein JWO38_8171 [Gemmataceae bacterium]|nr:hypothetical protein [Gemmataceae bacterium]